MSGSGNSQVDAPARTLSWIACALSLLVALFAGLYHIRTFDTFFHLATGRLILETGSVPRTDPFSFTSAGAPWLNHSWGFQALLAKLHALFGFEGLSIYQGLTASLLAFSGLWSVRRAPTLWPMAALLVVLPMAAFREVLEARPHVLGFLCLATVLLVCLEAMQPRRSYVLACLLPVYALWATVHGSHVLIYGILLLGLLLQLTRTDFAAALVWFACGTCVLGIGLWLAPSAFAQGGQHVASAFLESSVREWYPVTFSDLISFWPGRAFLLCWVLGLVGAVVAHKTANEDGDEKLPRGPFPLLLLAAFMLISLTSRRMLALYALGASPLWLPYAALALTRLSSALVSDASRCARILSAASLSGLLALGALVLSPNDTFRPGVGLLDQRMPTEAVLAMRREGRIKRVYNAYNFGGYLMWEGFPVFVDGRAITVYESDFLDAFERAYDDPRTFEALAKTYHCDGVLLPVSSTRVGRLRSYLSQSPRWRLTHRDAVAEVYEPR